MNMIVSIFEFSDFIHSDHTGNAIFVTLKTLLT